MGERVGGRATGGSSTVRVTEREGEVTRFGRRAHGACSYWRRRARHRESEGGVERGERQRGAPNSRALAQTLRFPLSVPRNPAIPGGRFFRCNGLLSSLVVDDGLKFRVLKS